PNHGGAAPSLTEVLRSWRGSAALTKPSHAAGPVSPAGRVAVRVVPCRVVPALLVLSRTEYCPYRWQSRTARAAPRRS
ncbi:hypothetical protein, partial [Cutibacterium granulosum]|uniref:hypothetical protein n=1 Tax=Cutibacterium granulosum TaxID=33011 RepID=UPI001F3F5555